MPKLFQGVAARLLRRALAWVEPASFAPSVLDQLTPAHTLRLTKDEADVFRRVAADAQKIARAFGDRQNSPSTLKPRDAEAIVTVCLNCGNLMSRLANDQHPVPEKPQ